MHFASTQRIVFFSVVCLLIATAVGSSLQATVVINEFLASNGSQLADEEGHFEDWIELFNTADAPVSLDGWSLSDSFGNPQKWTFPDGIQIPASGYLLIWASGKDRRNPGSPLHTNFSLSADGEELLLTRPDGSRADTVEPTPQSRDVSMGRTRDDPASWVFFHQPTPGGPNAGAAGHWLFETVTFSSSSKVFTETFTLELAGALPHQEIRYTTDGSTPSLDSTLYTGPLTIEQTTLMRAQVYEPNGATGAISSAQYIRLHPDLASFQATLPIIVLDAHGVELSHLPLAGPNARTSGYFQLFHPGPDGRTLLEGPAALATRQGIRLRGSSSRFSPKSPFSVEFQNERDEDAPLPLLGMSPDSDWVFYNGYEIDRTYFRNSLIYDLAREMGQWAPESRFVEVFFNRDGGELKPEDYYGVYAIIERIKQSPDRLGMPVVNPTAIPPDGAIDPWAEGDWTGGYIFKRDRTGEDEYHWRTPYHETDPNHTPLVLSRPKLADLDGGPYLLVEEADAHSRQVAYLKAFVESFEAELWTEYQSGFSDRAYLQYIDEASFVDYLLINAFSRDPDAIAISTYYHKPANQPIHAGPVWDYDRAMGSYDERSWPWDSWFHHELAVPFFNYHWWFPMVRDPDFMQAFYDRWAELRSGPFSDTSLHERILLYSGKINRSILQTPSAVSRDIARWPEVAPRDGNYINEVNHLRNWVLNRANWMDRRRRDGGLLPEPPQAQFLQGNNHYTHTLHFSPVQSGTIYYTLDASDPRGPQGIISGTPYHQPVTLTGSAHVTARVFENGHWSTPFSGSVEIIPHLLHYWSFNGENRQADYTYLNSTLEVKLSNGSTLLYDRGQSFSNANSQLGHPSESHLRLNRPIGSTLEFHLPTTGFSHPRITYETLRSGQGPGQQIIRLSTNGTDFFPFAEITVDDASPRTIHLDLTSIDGASDNPDLRLHIQFSHTGEGNSGNVRFDNFSVEGLPIDNQKAHPLVHTILPDQHLIAADGDHQFDLYRYFVSLDGNNLQFSLEVEDPDIVGASLQLNQLRLQAIRPGRTSVILRADNGISTPVPLHFRVLVEPAPFPLQSGTYHFDQWPARSESGHFPANMMFMQSRQSDPDIQAPFDIPYHIPAGDASKPEDVSYPYAAESRTRINGLGQRGIQFINTGRDRDSGTAVLALDTRYTENIRVHWEASTELANSRIYALRLQYRTSLTAPFEDVVDARGYPVEYTASSVSGDSAQFGPVTLPPDTLHENYVQLRWVYYYTGIRRTSESGARDAIRLDNIRVEADALPAHSYALWRLETFKGSARFDPEISGPMADPAGDGIPNLVRYAFGSTPGAELNERFPQVIPGDDQTLLQFGVIPEREDIEYTVEVSEDLTQWQPIYFSSLDLPLTLHQGWVQIPLYPNGDAYFLRVRIDPREP